MSSRMHSIHSWKTSSFNLQGKAALVGSFVCLRLDRWEKKRKMNVDWPLTAYIFSLRQKEPGERSVPDLQINWRNFANDGNWWKILSASNHLWDANEPYRRVHRHRRNFDYNTYVSRQQPSVCISSHEKYFFSTHEYDRPKRGLNDFLHEYLEAERVGQSQNLSCSRSYSTCPVSLFNLFRSYGEPDNQHLEEEVSTEIPNQGLHNEELITAAYDDIVGNKQPFKTDRPFDHINSISDY